MGVALRKDSRALEHASYAGLSEKWVSACDLKHGDKVLLSDGTLCEVESKRPRPLTTSKSLISIPTTSPMPACWCIMRSVGNRNCLEKLMTDISKVTVKMHTLKHKAGKIPKNQISRYDIYKDTASKNRLWIGDKSQSTWKPTDYYFDDLKKIWRK